jgi:hypothetical protein
MVHTQTVPVSPQTQEAQSDFDLGKTLVAVLDEVTLSCPCHSALCESLRELFLESIEYIELSKVVTGRGSPDFNVFSHLHTLNKQQLDALYYTLKVQGHDKRHEYVEKWAAEKKLVRAMSALGNQSLPTSELLTAFVRELVERKFDTLSRKAYGFVLAHN